MREVNGREVRLSATHDAGVDIVRRGCLSNLFVNTGKLHASSEKQNVTTTANDLACITVRCR